MTDLNRHPGQSGLSEHLFPVPDQFQEPLKSTCGECLIQTLRDIARHYQGKKDNQAYAYFLRGALAVNSDGQSSELGASMRLELFQLYVNTRNFEEALAEAQILCSEFQKSGHTQRLGRMWHNIGMVYSAQGKLNEAAEAYTSAVGFHRETGELTSLGQSLINFGEISAHLDRIEPSLKALSEALHITKMENNRRGQATVKNNLGLVYHKLNMHEQALNHFLDALSIREDMQDAQGKASILNNIGLVYRHLQQYENALENFQNSLAIKEAEDDQSGMARSLNNIGIIYLEMQDWPQALDYFQQALAIKRQQMNAPDIISTLNNLGEVTKQMGQVELGRDYFRQALLVAEEVGHHQQQAMIHINIGELELQNGQFEKARVILEDALQLADELNATKEQCEAHRYLAEVFDDSSEIAKAYHHFQRFHFLEKELRDLSTERKLADLRLQFELERKDKEARLIREKNLELQEKNQQIATQKEAVDNLNRELAGKNEELKSLNQELYEASITDKLTGIFNRKQILHLLNQEFSRALRYQQQLSIAILDIDFFKRVNDDHGHLAGDEVLRITSRRIQEQVRNEDHLGRYGGEEFLVVLPQTDLAGALATAEKIRLAVAAEPIKAEGAELSIHISLGISQLKGKLHPDINALIRAADEALYRAKESGRNRSVCADE